MSKVIGFRLDVNNPREARALNVLEAWQEAGYSTRHILTEALIRLEASDEEPAASLQLDEVVAALNKVNEQLGRLQQMGLQPARQPEQQLAVLSDAFLLSVKSAVKPGIQFEG